MHYYGAVMGPVALGAAAIMPDAGSFVTIARIALVAAGVMLVAYAVVMMVLFLYSAANRTPITES